MKLILYSTALILVYGFICMMGFSKSLKLENLDRPLVKLNISVYKYLSKNILSPLPSNQNQYEQLSQVSTRKFKRRNILINESSNDSEGSDY